MLVRWIAATLPFLFFHVTTGGAQRETLTTIAEDIRCIGSVPEEFASATQPYASLTQWCKDFASARCYRGLSSSPPLIFETNSGEDHLDVSFIDASRFKQFCSVKCHCAGKTTLDVPVIPSQSSKFPNRGDYAHVTHFDLPDQIGSQIPVRVGSQVVNVLFQRQGANRIQASPITGDIVNRPSCSNDYLPEELMGALIRVWDPLPMPFERYSDLCAHHYYGGNNRTNMGGICLPPEFPGGPRRFALPYELKSPIFTGETRRSLSQVLSTLPSVVDTICRRECFCENDRRKQISSDFNVNFADALDHSVGHAYKDDDRFQSTELDQLEELQALIDHAGGTSTLDGEQRICGGPCSNTRSCGGDGCQCYVKESVDPRHFWPMKRARTYEAICMPSDLREQSVARLGKQNGDRYDGLGRKGQQMQFVIACPCNVSYVSRSCCDAPDGIVWEPPELKLGEMLRGG